MKSILYILVSGIFVCLITSIGIQTELENFELPHDVVEQIKTPEDKNITTEHFDYTGITQSTIGLQD